MMLLAISPDTADDSLSCCTGTDGCGSRCINGLLGCDAAEICLCRRWS